MTDKLLPTLCDIATEAHTKIQQDFKNINPVIGVSQGMRTSGIPADAITIDCLKSGKRIILVLHDHHPDIINYQFSYRDEVPDSKFEQIQFNKLTATQMYEWIKSYFS
ncbi:MAG: hypothetical protein KZQ83_09315 [gamma proteobacterium symbiont of Taylorina sp.]|nr:hypothetical protein [gamma proteobacterium symbiont of Taylorina sp.]